MPPRIQRYKSIEAPAEARSSRNRNLLFYSSLSASNLVVEHVVLHLQPASQPASQSDSQVSQPVISLPSWIYETKSSLGKTSAGYWTTTTTRSLQVITGAHS
jgi:hypothetical protein